MRVLIIGLGSIGRKHVIALNQLDPNIEIYALRSRASLDTYLNVINIYEINEINEISFAIISNPTSEHKKTIEMLIGYNIPMFIEKPICSDLDIEDLISIIETKKIQTYIACNLRFLDCIKFVKERLNNETKRLNEVNVYCGSFLPEWRANVDFKETYSARAEMGGGVHIDLIHELDYIYWLFGKPNKVNRSFRSQSSLCITSFDYANYILDFDGFCTSVVLNYYRRDSKRNLELVFEDETWNVDLLKNKVVCNNKLIFSSEQSISDTYKLQMKYFLDSLNSANGTFNTVSNAYDVLKICLA
jgi:predicted dehydrogenase